MDQDKPQFDRSLVYHRKKLHISGDRPLHQPRRDYDHPLYADPKYSLKNSMFSPQPRPPSPLVGSPPTKKLRGGDGTTVVPPASDSPSNLNYFLPERHTPGLIGQNLLYARTFHPLGKLPNEPGFSPSGAGSHGQNHQPPIQSPPAPGTINTPREFRAERLARQGSESDEDERFLRLAREALVATANGVNPSGSTLVDPTIQDLLRRLQYAASPHGNPIKRSGNIRANENGQLMIQGFYQQFPNMSNDIFMGNDKNTEGSGSSSNPGSKSTPNHPSSYNDGWNFLIGEPVNLKGGMSYKEYETATAAAAAAASASTKRKRDHEVDEDDDDEDDDDDNDDGDDGPDLDRSDSSSSLHNKGLEDPSRKFLCSKCNMSFRRSSDLKRHEKQHLIIPPNICDLCGKGFARKDALKRHKGTLTCKRNADKKLYSENLKYLEERRNSGSFLREM